MMKNNSISVIGDNIFYLRTKKGLSQRKLASEVGVSCMAISLFENEKRYPKKETGEKIACYFGISYSDLTHKTLSNT